MNPEHVQDKLTRHLNFLAQDEGNANLLVEINSMYQELNDFESAQAYLDKAKVLAPEACLGYQGLLYLNQGQLDQAKICFLESLDYEDTAALRYNLGFCYFMTYEFKEALNILAPLADDDSLPETKLLIARILHRQGDLEEAIEWVKKILAIQPKHAEALGLLAMLYFDLNEDQLAQQMALTALESDPTNYDGRSVDILMRLLTQQTHAEEILNLLDINPDDCRMWFALGNTYMVQGELPKAEEALQKAVNLHPDFYDCFTVLAWCQLLNNQIDKAQHNYQTATIIAQELSDAWSGLALVHVLKEEFSESEQLIIKARDLNPECFLASIADTINFNHKNPAKAKEHLLKALQNTNMPIGEKLAFILEDMKVGETVH
jgi:tetratricopeptide (TPR) repeat protein